MRDAARSLVFDPSEAPTGFVTCVTCYIHRKALVSLRKSTCFSLVWLGAGASGCCWCFSLACGFLVVSFPFRGRRPEDRSEGVGIKEGVPASQSALLLGPEHSLRCGSHPMSSCDGVRPIVIRVGSVHPEGVTYTPHEGSSQPPDTGHQPENWQRVSMFFGSLHQKLRVGGPPTGSVHRDGSFFLCIVTGASVCCEWCTCSLATLRRHFLRAVAAAVFYVHVAAATSASCRGTSQQNITFQMFLQLQTLEASCITSCCGRRVPLSPAVGSSPKEEVTGH